MPRNQRRQTLHRILCGRFQGCFLFTPHSAKGMPFFIVVGGLTGWVVFLCVAFGFAFGPLLWGRLAAFSARLSQSLVAPSLLKRQVYVDDNHRGRFSRAKTATLHGCASVLGSWLRPELEARPERTDGRVDWFANSVCSGDGVAVQLTEAKTQAAKNSIDEILHGHAMLPAKKVVSFTGHMSWIASAAPVARTFVSMLWRALTDHTQCTPKRKHDEKAA